MSLIEEIQKRKTFAVIAHPDSGKTTLTEKLLLFGGDINIRYFWTKEQCDNGEIAIIHRATELMGAANVMTKPIQGNQFQNERYQLTNFAGSNDN